MKRCETCTHWDVEASRDWLEEDPTDPFGLDADDCDRVSGFKVGRCRSPKLIAFNRPMIRDHASVVDGSGYLAELHTAPDFGCVNHEHE